jgi:hypothetical protein
LTIYPSGYVKKHIQADMSFFSIHADTCKCTHADTFLLFEEGSYSRIDAIHMFILGEGVKEDITD